MNNTSEKLRRAQPLIPRTAGFIIGEAVVVWTNWDRLEVRNEQNKILLTYDAKEYLIHSEIEFVDNRYLVVSMGTGIMVNGFKIYDFELRDWSFEFIGSSVELGFCGMHPSAPIIAYEEEKGIILWDLSSMCRVSSIDYAEAFGVTAAIIGGPEGKIAFGNFEEILIFQNGKQILSSQVPGGDMTALAWGIKKTFFFAETLGERSRKEKPTR